MTRVGLTSTLLKAATYRGPRGLLDLEFRNGTRYRYFRVPREIYQGLLESESKGQYFNQHIRNCFPTVQLHFNGKLMVMTRARTAGHRS